MGRTPEELGDSMSSPDLAELMAFDGLYGYPDIYFLAGLICSTLEGLWSEKPRRIDQIIPFFGAGKPAMSGDDMAQRVMMMSRKK
jgi:hypothetical protein